MQASTIVLRLSSRITKEEWLDLIKRTEWQKWHDGARRLAQCLYPTGCDEAGWPLRDDPEA